MKNSKWKLTQRVASNIIVVFAGVAFFLALSNFDAVKEQLASWVRIIAPFIWGLALAYLLDGPVRFFEKKFHGHRGFAIVLACDRRLVSYRHGGAAGGGKPDDAFEPRAGIYGKFEPVHKEFQYKSGRG